MICNLIKCFILQAAVLLVVATTACSTRSPASQQSTSENLNHAVESPEWVTYGHDYSNSRFSTLRQINTGNASQLSSAYVVQTAVLGVFETTPIVSDGTMYITTAYDGVLAIRAVDGTVLWRRPPLSGNFTLCCGPVNRGVAITNDLLLIGQLDGTLVALDRKTGRLRWAKVVADNLVGYSVTMAPVVYRHSVLIGTAGSEFGIRGSLSSYSISNGNLQWRWYATDPEHWFGQSSQIMYDGRLLGVSSSARLRKQFANSWKRGGGGIWMTPAIDARRNLVYAATGNPWPDTDGTRRPGDNLFTDCVVALDASTGRMRWYFQETAHDTRDLDAASPPILFDTIDRDGRKVAAVGEAGKTGFFYVLNRDTGKLIRRSQYFASLDAATRGLGEWKGGSSWSPVSFDPNLGYVIVSAAQHLEVEAGSRRVKHVDESLSTHNWNTGYGTVSAVDVASGRIIWQDKFNRGLVGGSASTAGGVTFVGEGDGYFDALETKTGLLLWQFQTGAGVNAAPSVFEVDDREYVAVASGGNLQFGTPFGDALFVFRLKN